MNEFLKRMIFTKMIIFGSDSIDLFGRKVALIPIEVILEMERSLAESVGEEKAREMVYSWGVYQTETGSRRYLSAKKTIARMLQKLPKTGDPSLEMGREVIKLSGWGDICILTNKNRGEEMTLEVKGSPFVHEYMKANGKSKKPVCNYLAGLIAGVANATYGRKCACTEKSCAASGITEKCVFEVRAAKTAP